MKNKKKVLNIAKAKVRHNTGREFYGYLTPSEFLALYEAGIMIKWKSDLKWMDDARQDGESNPRYCYFELGSMTLEQ